MRSPTLTKPTDEDLILGIEEKDPDPMSGPPQHLQNLSQWAEELPLPDIDDEGDAVNATFRMGAEISDGGDEGGGKIVDAKKSEVLQGLDRLALSSSRHPGHNNKFHGSTDDGSEFTDGRERYGATVNGEQ
jgi:hypothetical protein